MFGNDDAVMAPPQASKPKPVKKPMAELRVRLTKKELLDRFKRSNELDFTTFEKEGLLENADLFHSSGTQGEGKEPENYGVDPDDKTVYNSYKKSAASSYKPGGSKPFNKGNNQQQHGHNKPNNYDDDDEPDPEWMLDDAALAR